MVGGEVEELKSNLKDSFSRIKEDISKLNLEMSSLKEQYHRVSNENTSLKNQLEINKQLIKSIVEETVKSLGSRESFNERIIRKINRNKKIIIKNRILELAARKNLEISEMKDLLVHDEKLCSRATFYRYVEKLKSKNLIDLVQVESQTIIVSI